MSGSMADPVSGADQQIKGEAGIIMCTHFYIRPLALSLSRSLALALSLAAKRKKVGEQSFEPDLLGFFLSMCG